MYIGSDGREYEDLEADNMREDEYEAGDCYYYPELETLVHKVMREQTYYELASCEGDEPYSELEAALKRTLERVQQLRDHRHEWDDSDFCTICGRDGRV